MDDFPQYLEKDKSKINLVSDKFHSHSNKQDRQWATPILFREIGQKLQNLSIRTQAT